MSSHESSLVKSFSLYGGLALFAVEPEPHCQDSYRTGMDGATSPGDLGQGRIGVGISVGLRCGPHESNKGIQEPHSSKLGGERRGICYEHRSRARCVMTSVWAKPAGTAAEEQTVTNPASSRRYATRPKGHRYPPWQDIVQRQTVAQKPGPGQRVTTTRIDKPGSLSSGVL
ncbi:hypothetical protein CTA2_3166 [Colletotrichum tanaceti]|nr:hypothetical protein CTA2_3166 [Colletotrichum tanaceti]